MEIFVSAGEASSDLHLSHLIAELKKRRPQENYRFFGLAGQKSQEQGVELLMDSREFSVGGGPVEILSKLPKRSRLERLVESRLFERTPDAAILVDSGEINLRLASLLHFFGVRIVYFIPPKVWVWRHSRIEKIAQHIGLVLSILPFEEPIYREWEIPFRYVGNPLWDEVPFELTESEAKQRLGIRADQSVVTVFPGSRHSEVKYHLPIFAEAIKRFFELLPANEPRPLILVPCAATIEQAVLENGLRALLPQSICTIKVVKGQSHECLKAARAAIVKSGTSTLEAAVLGTPMVLAYASSKSTSWLYRNLVRYKGFVGLVNLFLSKDPESALGWGKPEIPIVPELILERCRPDLIAKELFAIYSDSPERVRMIEALAHTRNLLSAPGIAGGSPLAAAAEACELFFNSEVRNV